jgi:hypothetical protein
MGTYARIDGKIVREVVTISPTEDITKMFHPDLKFVFCPSEVKVEEGWTYEGGAFSAPAAAPAETTAQLWAARRAEARGLLKGTDLVALRCFKAGVAFPAAWLVYVKALRSIVQASSGDPTQAMPVAPAYPAGT